ncbi:hypothetical protein GE107_03480 [Cohnella sp. CFH 77786]|uniref:hypothetical protein n=1 Tax=Cohnella sp. CFH 77786 TaxID=2662265 RepID=UPI001C60E54F|nr:hypothetical protein [Cohnella sp. CFH 77786]MBW5445126.1 hypothetical protein [Cohnella sp. CFH 77786]
MDEAQLDQFRIEGTKVRVIRDALEQNDVVGIVVAWDDASVLIRRPNRRVVKVERKYRILPADEPRTWDIGE